MSENLGSSASEDLIICPSCNGIGTIEIYDSTLDDPHQKYSTGMKTEICFDCNGYGRIPSLLIEMKEKIPYEERLPDAGETACGCYILLVPLVIFDIWLLASNDIWTPGMVSLIILGIYWGYAAIRIAYTKRHNLWVRKQRLKPSVQEAIMFVKRWDEFTSNPTQKS